jgi:hypothetical protein
MACLGMAVAEEAGACTDNIPSAVSSAFRHIHSYMYTHSLGCMCVLTTVLQRPTQARSHR